MDLGAASGVGASQTEEDLEFTGFERKRSVGDGKAVCSTHPVDQGSWGAHLRLEIWHVIVFVLHTGWRCV